MQLGQRSHELINYPDPSIPLWISRPDKLEDFWEPDIWRFTKSIAIPIAGTITVLRIGYLRAVWFSILNILAMINKIWLCCRIQYSPVIVVQVWASEWRNSSCNDEQYNYHHRNKGTRLIVGKGLTCLNVKPRNKLSTTKVLMICRLGEWLDVLTLFIIILSSWIEEDHVQPSELCESMVSLYSGF